MQIDCPVKKVIEVEDGQVVLYDFVCFAAQYPGVSNVVRFDTEGQAVWHAETPEKDVLYIGMGLDKNGIWCGTLNYLVCTIDLKTGKIMDQKTIE